MQMKILKFIIFFSLFLGLIFITGCGDDNTVPVDTHDDAYVDVIVKKVNVQGIAKFKLMFFAGGAGISKEGSTVITPDSRTFELKEFWAGPGKITNGEDPLTPDKPETGKYVFILKFDDGYEKELKDVVSDVDVALVTELVVTHKEGSDEISATWAGGEGGDLVCLKLTELDIANTMPLFKIAGMPKDKTSYTFDTTTSAAPGWMRSPSKLVRGTQYWLVVSAKKVEAGTQVSGASQDFEQNSCAKIKLTW